MPLNALAASDNIAESDFLRKNIPILYFYPEEKVFPWGINSMLDNADLKKLRNKRSADEADLDLAERELENMAEIARLSKKFVRKKGIDKVDEELAEIEETLKGINLVEKLLKPIFYENRLRRRRNCRRIQAA